MISNALTIILIIDYKYRLIIATYRLLSSILLDIIVNSLSYMKIFCILKILLVNIICQTNEVIIIFHKTSLVKPIL